MEQFGFGMTGRVGEPDAAHAFLDADRDLEEPQPQGGELGPGQIADRRDGVARSRASASRRRCAGRGGPGWRRPAARGAVGGEMGLVGLDQVLGLAAGAVEGLIDDARADGSDVGDHEADVETEFVSPRCGRRPGARASSPWPCGGSRRSRGPRSALSRARRVRTASATSSTLARERAACRSGRTDR